MAHLIYLFFCTTVECVGKFGCERVKIWNLQQYKSMAESKLAQLNFGNSSYNKCSIVFMYFSMLRFGRILISSLVVADLFMHSLPGIQVKWLQLLTLRPCQFLNSNAMHMHACTVIHGCLLDSLRLSLYWWWKN